MPTLVKTVAGFVFDNPLGKLAAALAGLLALISVFGWEQRSSGARNERNDINQSAAVLTGKARTARNAAGAPGAALRLRRQYCGDC